MFDDVRDFVVAHIVERVRVAGAAAETAPFRETEGVVVGDAGISPQIQRVGIIREKGTEVVLAGDSDFLVAKLAEILFLFLETLEIICGRIASVKADLMITGGHDNPDNLMKDGILHIIRGIRMTLFRRLEKEYRRQFSFLFLSQKLINRFHVMIQGGTYFPVSIRLNGFPNHRKTSVNQQIPSKNGLPSLETSGKTVQDIDVVRGHDARRARNDLEYVWQIEAQPISQQHRVLIH